MRNGKQPLLRLRTSIFFLPAHLDCCQSIWSLSFYILTVSFIHACSSSPPLFLVSFKISPGKSYLCIFNVFVFFKCHLPSGSFAVSFVSLWPNWLCLKLVAEARCSNILSAFVSQRDEGETMEGERLECSPTAGLSGDWWQLEICPDEQQMKKSVQEKLTFIIYLLFLHFKTFKSVLFFFLFFFFSTLHLCRVSPVSQPVFLHPRPLDIRRNSL